MMIEGACHCGAARWRFEGVPEAATACNCTLCRRYGVLWAYGLDGDEIHIDGPTRIYRRGAAIDFHFCETCGCVVCWRGREADEAGKHRIAVNLRLAEPDEVGEIIVDHFDGLTTFKDLGRDGRRVKDLWF